MNYQELKFTENVEKPEGQQEAAAKKTENPLLRYATFAEYDKAFESEVKKEGEAFIRIGYLLRIGQDTDIIRQSGFSSVAEYAEEKFQIDKSQASRYMSVNERFSEGGYSDRIAEQYQGFGIAKLVIMLQLPEEINEEITPAFSKNEIQAIKEEVDEERQTTDLELLLEAAKEPPKSQTMLQSVIGKLLEDEPELYKELHEYMTSADGLVPEGLKPILAPAGEKIYSVRIMGTGRVLFSVKDSEDTATLTPVRTPEEKVYCDWDSIREAIGGQMVHGLTAEEAYHTIFGKEFPKTEEVAPVQPEKPTTKRVDKKKKVSKAKKEQTKNPPHRVNTESEAVFEAAAEDKKDTGAEETVARQQDTTVAASEIESEEPKNVSEALKSVAESPENVSEALKIVSEPAENGAETQENVEEHPESVAQTFEPPEELENVSAIAEIVSEDGRERKTDGAGETTGDEEDEQRKDFLDFVKETMQKIEQAIDDYTKMDINEVPEMEISAMNICIENTELLLEVFKEYREELRSRTSIKKELKSC